jgi:hypothetical protein
LRNAKPESFFLTADYSAALHEERAASPLKKFEVTAHSPDHDVGQWELCDAQWLKYQVQAHSS